VGIDPDFAPVYLGGYHQGGARDDRINDNFSAFVVRLQSKVRLVNPNLKEGPLFD